MCRCVLLAVVAWTLGLVLFGSMPVPGFSYAAEFLLRATSAIAGLLGSAMWTATTAFLVVLFLCLSAVLLAAGTALGAVWLARRYDLAAIAWTTVCGLFLPHVPAEDRFALLFTLLHLVDVFVLRETGARGLVVWFIYCEENVLPFLCALPCTSTSLVAQVIQVGADTNELWEGETPLDLAIWTENLPVVWLLLLHGARRSADLRPRLPAPGKAESAGGPGWRAGGAPDDPGPPT